MSRLGSVCSLTPTIVLPDEENTSHNNHMFLGDYNQNLQVDGDTDNDSVY